MEEQNPELEQFREQWRAEVSARSQPERPKTSKPSRRPPPISSLSSTNVPNVLRGEDQVEPQLVSLDGFRDDGQSENSKSKGKEPQSALEHYEKAVERENEGSLGDSLNLYRKAFRVGRLSV
jgi:F-box protein 9